MRLDHVLIHASAGIRTLPLLLLLFASQAPAQSAVPVHEEPRHRLVFSQQQLKLMDVEIQPGDTTLFHVHDAPALFITIATSPVDVQELGGPWIGTLATAARGRKQGDVNVDTSYAHRRLTHRVTNIGTTPFRLIAMTNSDASPAVHAVTGPPGRLELRNRWFAQSRVRLSAGGATPWYSAATATIVVAPFGGPASVLLESGVAHALSTSGSWNVIPSGARYRLSSTGPATLVVVQVM